MWPLVVVGEMKIQPWFPTFLISIQISFKACSILSFIHKKEIVTFVHFQNKHSIGCDDLHHHGGNCHDSHLDTHDSHQAAQDDHQIDYHECDSHQIDHDSDQDDFQLLLKASPSAAPLRHRRDLQRSKTAQKVSGQFLKKLQWTKK